MIRTELSEKKAELLYGVPRKTITRHMNQMVKKIRSIRQILVSIGI